MAHPLRNLVAMSTVGLLFVGGVAAAATGTNPLSPLLGANEDAGPSLTTTTVDTTTTSTAAAHAAALNDEVVCPDDLANHGEAVSEVAHDKSNVGAEHGAAVSAMARSDCGKTDSTDEVEDEDAPEPEPTDDEVVCPDDVANHGEAVSEVAHDKSNVGAEHGAAVSAMARSDCGKTDGSDGDEDENEERAAHESAGKSGKKNGHHNDDDGNELGS